MKHKPKQKPTINKTVHVEYLPKIISKSSESKFVMYYYLTRDMFSMALKARHKMNILSGMGTKVLHS